MMQMSEGGLAAAKQYELERLSMADGGMYAGHDETMQVQSDGTTIMALKYKGGILLGADSRSSNVSHKIQVCLYGSEIHLRVAALL